MMTVIPSLNLIWTMRYLASATLTSLVIEPTIIIQVDKKEATTKSTIEVEVAFELTGT